jgi:hypothetical protein
MNHLNKLLFICIAMFSMSSLCALSRTVSRYRVAVHTGGRIAGIRPAVAMRYMPMRHFSWADAAKGMAGGVAGSTLGVIVGGGVGAGAGLAISLPLQKVITPDQKKAIKGFFTLAGGGVGFSIGLVASAVAGGHTGMTAYAGLVTVAGIVGKDKINEFLESMF